MKNSSDTIILEKQARLFTRYLINKPANSRVTKVYVHALHNNPPAIEDYDNKLIALVMKQPRLLSMIDAGLPFVRPYSELRRRIYLMLSILESDPEYSEDFLPKQRGLSYILTIGFSGIFALTKAIFGVVFLKVVS